MLVGTDRKGMVEVMIEKDKETRQGDVDKVRFLL